jgi:uracil-DNA glycosylase
MECKEKILALAAEARACTLCARELPHDPRPVFQVAAPAPILLVGQAPGRRAHDSKIPWNDASGDTLRAWLGVDREAFYDPHNFAILPAGLCYPGTDPKRGDRAPLARCAPTWHPRFLELLEPALRLRLYIGRYAIAHHLPTEARRSVGEVVAMPNFRRRLRDGIVALPHPSPRNRRWIAQRPWFERDLIPDLRRAVAAALARPHPSRRGTSTKTLVR